MRRYLPALLLVSVTVSAPLLGCDLIANMKGGSADAAADAAAVVATLEDAGLVVPVVPVVVDAAVAPLPTLTPTPTGTVVVKPVVVVDASAPKDAGSVSVDAAAPRDGGPAPAPTPTLNLPNLFDGGSLKFDAGGFKPPWVR